LENVEQACGQVKFSALGEFCIFVDDEILHDGSYNPQDNSGKEQEIVSE
jgi:hypothetical protein